MHGIKTNPSDCPRHLHPAFNPWIHILICFNIGGGASIQIKNKSKIKWVNAGGGSYLLLTVKSCLEADCDIKTESFLGMHT